MSELSVQIESEVKYFEITAKVEVSVNGKKDNELKDVWIANITKDQYDELFSKLE